MMSQRCVPTYLLCVYSIVKLYCLLMLCKVYLKPLACMLYKQCGFINCMVPTKMFGQ